MDFPVVKMSMLQGLPEEELYRIDDPGVTYLIGCGFADAAEILKRVRRSVASAHPKLRAELDFFLAPYSDGHPDTVAEVKSKGMNLGGSAWRVPEPDGRGCVYVWGRNPADFSYYTLGLNLIEHELAHLAGHDGSVPWGLRGRWHRARKADLAVQEKLAVITPYRQITKVQGARRQFLSDQPWLNQMVLSQPTPAKRLAEDWADSVTYYLDNLRKGYIWKRGDQVLDFAERYPNRSEIIREWLAS